jgi:hypothetical protein
VTSPAPQAANMSEGCASREGELARSHLKRYEPTNRGFDQVLRSGTAQNPTHHVSSGPSQLQPSLTSKACLTHFGRRVVGQEGSKKRKGECQPSSSHEPRVVSCCAG